MTDLLDALLHAAAYALVGGAMLVVAYYVLDLATPGHLGTHLRGVDENGNESVHAHSKGAGVVTSAWLVSNAAVLFTAIWTNGETSLGYGRDAVAFWVNVSTRPVPPDAESGLHLASRRRRARASMRSTRRP